MMTNVQDSTQRSPGHLKSVSRPCGTAHVHVPPYSRGDSMCTSVGTEQPSLSNGYLSPRNMPVLSPKPVKQLVSPNNKQSIPYITMPLLSPCNRQSPSPGIVQTVGTKCMSSFSSRQLFTDNGQQLPNVNRQSSTNNKGRIPSPNNLNHSAQFVDHQGYSLDQQNQLIAELTRTRTMYTLDQECRDQISNTWLPPSAPGPITPSIANGINNQSVVCSISIPSSGIAYGQQNSHSQGTCQVVHKLHNTDLSKPKFPPNPALNPSESANQMMSSKVCHDGAALEQNLRVNHGQNYNCLPVYDLTSKPGLSYMSPAAENSKVKVKSTNATGGNMVAGQWPLSGHAKSATVNGTEHVTRVTRNDQTGTMSGSEEQPVSAQPHYKVTSIVTQSRHIGQYTMSAPLGQQIHLKTLGRDVQSGPLLHQRMSSLQEPVNDLNVPQLPSPELLQSMMADNSPSKFVVMKMTESDKYVILSPEKSSTSEMVYKPMGSMKLPPGKYRLHTVNANPLSNSSAQGQTTEQQINLTSPNDGAQRTHKTKPEGKILKIKGSKCSKEKKECKKERKGKQQPNKVATNKKKNNKMEKKKKTASEKDKKTKASERKPIAQDKKPKSKPKKADDPKAKEPKAKGKKTKTKSNPVVKKTEEKKDICRVLSPCQRFCKAVLISHNKAGRLIHTGCNPVIFFTGGQFSESQDIPEVEHPVYLLTSDNNNHILAIMSEAFSPGQFLLSSQRPINFKDKFIPSDLQVEDADNCQFQYNLYQAVLSPYHFTITSPMKGHKVILISQYKDSPIVTSPREGTLDNPEVREGPNIISDVIDTWDQSYDITTMTPCTHPLYKVMNEMLKKKVEVPPKTCKFKLRVQLFDSRRKKRQKICDEI